MSTALFSEHSLTGEVKACIDGPNLHPALVRRLSSFGRLATLTLYGSYTSHKNQIVIKEQCCKFKLQVYSLLVTVSNFFLTLLL